MERIITLKNRKSYVPRLRGKDELVQEVRIKKSWRDAGSANNFFSI